MVALFALEFWKSVFYLVSSQNFRAGSVSKATEQTYWCGPPTFCLGVDLEENVVVRKRLRRGQVIAFFEALTPCLVGMEACATSHYWAGSLTKLGHEVRLMPARDVNAYVKRNKNDAADAEAIVPHCFSHGALASRQGTLIGSMSLRVGTQTGPT